MDTNKSKKPFIPSDKPKSWVTAILAGLSGLLIAGPLMFLGHFLQWQFLQSFGKLIFVLCWLTVAVAGFVFMAGNITGKYKKIEEKDWRDQVW